MKTRLKTAVVGVAVFLSVAAVVLATDVKNETFSVTLPAGFSDFAKQSAKAADGIETTTWVSKAPTNEAVVVSVSQMPKKILDPGALLDATRDSLLKSVKGTLDSEQKVDGAMPARVLAFHSGTAVFLRSRLVVDNDRLFNVLYVGRSVDQAMAPAVGQLFDSFQFAPRPAAAPAAPAAPGAASAAPAAAPAAPAQPAAQVTTAAKPQPPVHQ